VKDINLNLINYKDTKDSNGDRKCVDKEKLPKRLVRADWSSGMVARILAIGSGRFCNVTAR